MKENTPRSTLQLIMRTQIPGEVLENLNSKYGLGLAPGATYRDAMDRRAEELAKRSPEWAALYEEYYGKPVTGHE